MSLPSDQLCLTPVIAAVQVYTELHCMLLSTIHCKNPRVVFNPSVVVSVASS